MSAKIIGMGRHDFVNNEEVRTRTRLVPLNETFQKQRVSLLQIARLYAVKSRNGYTSRVDTENLQKLQNHLLTINTQNIRRVCHYFGARGYSYIIVT